MAFRQSFISLARTPPRIRLSAIHKAMKQADTEIASGNATASSSRLLPHFKVPRSAPRTPSSPEKDVGTGLPEDRSSNLLTVLDGPPSIPTKRSYYIVKPRSGDWPVYSKFRNGGACTTVIKGIKGDVEAFSRDVNEHFLSTHIDPLTRPSRASVRPNTLHVWMKGHVVSQVKEWMMSQKL